MPRRLMVRLRILIPSIEVRILAGHPISLTIQKMCSRSGAISTPAKQTARTQIAGAMANRCCCARSSDRRQDADFDRGIDVGRRDVPPSGLLSRVSRTTVKNGRIPGHWVLHLKDTKFLRRALCRSVQECFVDNHACLVPVDARHGRPRLQPAGCQQTQQLSLTARMPDLSPP